MVKKTTHWFIDNPDYYLQKDKWKELQSAISFIHSKGFKVFTEPLPKAKNTKSGLFPLIGKVIYPDGKISVGNEKYNSAKEATIAVYNIYLFLYKKYGDKKENQKKD